MHPVVYVVAGPIDRRTGGSIYNRRMVDGLRTLGWTVTVVELTGVFPDPDAATKTRAAEAFASIAAGSLALVDGLAFSALPDVAEAHRDRLALVAVVHLPIAAGFGLDASRATRYEAAERRALAAARWIVVTGPGALPLLAPYGVPAERTTMVEPGTDPGPLAEGSSGGVLQLLTVATVHPGKGHDLLLAALEPLVGAEWELTCAGSLNRDPAFVEELRGRAARSGLADRIHFVGDVPAERLDGCYASADVFVLATRQETYGMAVAEALARGLPVVSTETGAIAALVNPDAGLVVPPGDTEAFAGALRSVITNSDLRQRLAAGARTRRPTLPTWPAAAVRLAEVLEGVSAHG